MIKVNLLYELASLYTTEMQAQDQYRWNGGMTDAEADQLTAKVVDAGKQAVTSLETAVGMFEYSRIKKSD